MTFRATILTLFPDMFPGTLGHSLAGKALAEGKWGYDAHDIRAHATDRHRTVDDHPAGGGAGMVLKPDILARAIDATPHYGPRLLMSPRGIPFTQNFARELAAGEGCMIICGRFEGYDERVITSRNLQEVSIGDFILSGGEPAALTMLDSIIRLLPGVMGHDESHAEESFEDGLLERIGHGIAQQVHAMHVPVVAHLGAVAAVTAHGKWQAIGQGQNRIHLPAAEDLIHRAAMVQEAVALPERQFVEGAHHEAARLIVIGDAALEVAPAVVLRIRARSAALGLNLRHRVDGAAPGERGQNLQAPFEALFQLHRHGVINRVIVVHVGGQLRNEIAIRHTVLNGRTRTGISAGRTLRGPPQAVIRVAGNGRQRGLIGVIETLSVQAVAALITNFE